MENEYDTGHWKFFKSFNPEHWVGFIYVIVHIPTGRQYIGKKFFWCTTRKIIKNKKNRKKIIKESNWKKYTGSCKWLNAEIELLGKENFSFRILSLHESRSTLAFREVQLLVLQDALRARLADGTKAYFNGLIPPIKFTVSDDTVLELEYRDER